MLWRAAHQDGELPALDELLHQRAAKLAHKLAHLSRGREGAAAAHAVMTRAGHAVLGQARAARRNRASLTPAKAPFSPRTCCTREGRSATLQSRPMPMLPPLRNASREWRSRRAHMVSREDSVGDYGSTQQGGQGGQALPPAPAIVLDDEGIPQRLHGVPALARGRLVVLSETGQGKHPGPTPRVNAHLASALRPLSPELPTRRAAPRPRSHGLISAPTHLEVHGHEHGPGRGGHVVVVRRPLHLHLGGLVERQVRSRVGAPQPVPWREREATALGLGSVRHRHKAPVIARASAWIDEARVRVLGQGNPAPAQLSEGTPLERLHHLDAGAVLAVHAVAQVEEHVHLAGQRQLPHLQLCSVRGRGEGHHIAASRCGNPFGMRSLANRTCCTAVLFLMYAVLHSNVPAARTRVEPSTRDPARRRSSARAPALLHHPVSHQCRRPPACSRGPRP